MSGTGTGTGTGTRPTPMRDPRILILDTSIRILYPSILVLALYFVFSGHNRPGGGFVGGLVVGAALALRYVSGGAAAVRSTFRLPPHVILGLGLFLSSFTAFLPLLLGGAILEHGDVEFHLPVFDKVKVTSALSFDLGVDFVVIGLILMAFAAFGEDLPNAPDATDDGSDDPNPRPPNPPAPNPPGPPSTRTGLR